MIQHFLRSAICWIRCYCDLPGKPQDPQWENDDNSLNASLPLSLLVFLPCNLILDVRAYMGWRGGVVSAWQDAGRIYRAETMKDGHGVRRAPTEVLLWSIRVPTLAQGIYTNQPVWVFEGVIHMVYKRAWGQKQWKSMFKYRCQMNKEIHV